MSVSDHQWLLAQPVAASPSPEADIAAVLDWSSRHCWTTRFTEMKEEKEGDGEDKEKEEDEDKEDKDEEE